jgi:hypothetical protein
MGSVAISCGEEGLTFQPMKTILHKLLNNLIIFKEIRFDLG